MYSFLGVLLLLISSIGWAQDPNKDINYLEVVNEILRTNLDILSSILNEEMAYHRLQSERHALVPTLSAGGEFFRNSGQTQSSTGQIFRDLNFSRYQPQVSLNFNLNIGEQLYLSRSAWNEYESSRFQISDTRQKILLIVSELYQKLLLSREGIRIAEQLTQNSSQVFNIIRSRTEAGVALTSDMIQIQAKLASNKEQIVKAKNQWVQVSIQLAHLLRWDPNINLIPSEVLIPQPSVYQVLRSLSPEFQVAERPDIKAARWASVAADEQKKATQWDFWGPSLSLRAAYIQLGDKTNNLDSGERYFTALSWDFSWSDWDQIKVQSRKADLARVQLEKLNDQARAEILEATQDIKATLERIPLAKESLTAEEDTLKLIIARYLAGKTLLIDVLLAQDRLAQAQLNAAKTIAAYNLAQMNYLAAVGQLDRTTLFELYQVQYDGVER
ncbi:putative Outer membrane efflux protein [Candidatus Nitrosacidococcus tergens]|uniref:Putative Outer membrane efflux protein n=2 Tax=Candidatus Nitrosacidococcus tergens TaxID=553981 RepID=A0A7G1Q7P2_9GAMM|nr:putative Outer membrane efflux protein [Candidatus Nitrosacidococcus tergens]